MRTKVAEGDEVRFLDEKGEGIVTGFDRQGNALVQTSDGFVIPFLPNKLVVVGRKELSSHSDAPIQSTIKEEQLSLIFTLINKAFVQISLGNGIRENFLLVLYASIDKNYQLIGNYILNAHQAVVATTIPFVQLTNIDRFYIRVMPLPKEASFLPGVWSGFVKHRSPKLADPEQWQWNESGAYRMLQIAFYPDVLPEKQPNIPRENFVSEKKVTVQRHYLLTQERDGQYEVDLHLEELLESTAGMDNFEMVSYQMRHFERCLDEAVERKIHRFVAIHGVGKGRLREEIRKILQNRSITFYDAPYNRYGYGATEVRLKS
ncbi:MAG: Smr/MutS family protein [Bacteroidia bacterium]|nr:Smr/MutS family protein [Bacteroidia bacterium]MCC6768749.1 Smr/MutS family protein [Bacteroidia bacterium]